MAPWASSLAAAAAAAAVAAAAAGAGAAVAAAAAAAAAAVAAAATGAAAAVAAAVAGAGASSFRPCSDGLVDWEADWQHRSLSRRLPKSELEHVPLKVAALRARALSTAHGIHFHTDQEDVCRSRTSST